MDVFFNDPYVGAICQKLGLVALAPSPYGRFDLETFSHLSRAEKKVPVFQNSIDKNNQL